MDGLLMVFAIVVAVVWGQSGAMAAPQAVRFEMLLRETIHADPEESEIVDSTSVLATFGLETTLRVGNQMMYVIASPVDENRIELDYALFVTGPISDQRGDQTILEYGTPLILDDIKGKGKSSYRVLLTATPSDTVPKGVALPEGGGDWVVTPSVYYYFHMSPRALAQFHFPELRNALEYEFEAVKDSLNLDAPGKTDYFFIDGPSLDVPFDPRFDYQVDPSRDRILARHDPQYTGVEVTATLLLKVYRWWGYAPELLAIGISGYTTFADYHVLQDWAAGTRIPLSNLARSIDFKRQDYPASFHHAASFVKWLIREHGVASFRELYGKATDLSLERALFSVYQKTLAELESDWRGYLNRREFDPGEYYDYAKRAAAYHQYQEHYDLLQLAAAGHHDPPAFIYRGLTLAAAQLGEWDAAVDHAYHLAEYNPTDTDALSLLAEVQWAAGDVDGAQYHLLRVTERDSADARPYITLGDIQMDRLRTDSARVLWEIGLSKTDGLDPAALELLLRLGRYQRTHRNPDSARVLFNHALALAQRLVPKVPSGARPLTRLGESLMEADSLKEGLAFLETAAFVADAPQELGRALINLGRCHDLAGRRESAVAAYEAVFQIPATYHHRKLARQYLNKIYSH
ncbi:MAG: hypothetical protein Kow0074_20660 [Candidatus Zixiibacteriota bacterium]